MAARPTHGVEAAAAEAKLAMEADDPGRLAAVADLVPVINDATLLALAAKMDAAACCEWLLHQDSVDPNVGKRKTTPLCAAAAAGALRAVRVLLRDGRADPNRARMDGVTPLLIATQQQHLAIVRLLLLDRRTRSNCRALYPLRITPLLLAIRSGGREAVHALLDLGRDMDLEQNRFQRDGPLAIARSVGAPPSVERMLLDFEATGAVHRDAERYAALDDDPEMAAAALGSPGVPPPGTGDYGAPREGTADGDEAADAMAELVAELEADNASLRRRNAILTARSRSLEKRLASIAALAAGASPVPSTVGP